MKLKIIVATLFLVNSLLVLSQQKPLFTVSSNTDTVAKESFEGIKKLILDQYYYDGISENDLYWAAIEGMLQKISPPESPNLAQLWTDEEYEKILNSLKGVKVTLGFGSSFNGVDGSLTISSFTAGSNAEEQLQVGDRILRIDNEGLKGKSLAEVNQLLDGKLGESSTLKVVRDIEIFDVTLTRETLKSENLIVTEIPGRKVALVEVKKVTLGIASELEAEMSRLKADQITSVILDFRNNVGGVLNEGINIGRLYMKSGDIVLRTQTRSKGITNYTAEIDKFHDFKVIVLVNENTASAAEIVTSALQDHNRAIVVGKKTYGKGVIETTFTLENQYRVKFITNAMYSPKGNSWQKKGLLPDYFIDQSQANYKAVANMEISIRQGKDLHLSTALKLLQ